MNETNEDPLTHQQVVWESWAQADPLWAILSDPARRGRRWDVDEFFATGKPDIDQALAQAGEHGLPAKRSRALDFGCGVGRLTQALAAEFEHVDGVDISQTMVDLARDYNKVGERCDYHVNLASDLALFPDRTMDFVFSTIVLQHVPPEHAATYICEFVRLLAPGGAAVFDMTAALPHGGAARGCAPRVDRRRRVPRRLRSRAERDPHRHRDQRVRPDLAGRVADPARQPLAYARRRPSWRWTTAAPRWSRRTSPPAPRSP